MSSTISAKEVVPLTQPPPSEIAGNMSTEQKARILGMIKVVNIIDSRWGNDLAKEFVLVQADFKDQAAGTKKAVQLVFDMKVRSCKLGSLYVPGRIRVS